MGIQIYDQISIIRNCSKVKLRHAFSLGLGLKVVKIDWNIVKVGVHACLSNGRPNILECLKKFACMLVHQMGIQIYDQI